ncbi:MAG: hypothetical protein EBS13_09370, partial [Verrucomicrobia bacterium]|nr:hypothetical protein [Verrucomicrobiota bacterium]
MRVLAVLFRLFSLLGVLAFSGMLWLKFDTLNKQSFSYLDEIIDDSYSILQSEQEAKWKDLGEKKSIFNDIFDSNEQVEDGEENKLAGALENLKVSEDSLLRNADYRDRLDRLTKEFGPGTMYWDSETGTWQINKDSKLESPAGFKDPFEDETQFPLVDKTLADGTVLKGVPHHQRLRTVIGMFYKDRDDKFKEISKLREMVVARDQELREYQNLYAKEKERKEQLEGEVGELTVKVAGLEEDLKREKEDRQAEKEAAEQKEEQLNRIVADLEEQKIKTAQEHQEFVDTLRNEQKEQMAALQDEIRKADAEGYKRGIDEMIAKQQGGEVEQQNEEVAVNPFLPTEDGPPKLSQAELMLAAQAKTIGETGVPSTVGRVDGKSGMILLPLGSERG